MRTRLHKLYEDVRASYWFIPFILSSLAAVLAVALVDLDGRLDWPSSLPFFFTTQPDGSRALLSAIGGSMIGVAGTVFSVTMAAVVYASGSYGPRLLTNFMTDRGNQFTLGTFTATFVYCILVLRTVQDEAREDGIVVIEGFVPILSTFGATILGLCSIGVLIYFIHHVPSNIHVSNVVAGIGRSLLEDIDKRFPIALGHPRTSIAPASAEAGRPPAAFLGTAEDADFAEVPSGMTGYIQIIDEMALLAVAREHDLVVRLKVRPGAFLHADRIVFDVFPPAKLDERLHEALRGTLATGAKRTSVQDLLFLFDELVEIAARALSPGVNDPYTAVNCIDWMGAAMAELARRPRPDAVRLDEQGRVRLLTRPLGFEEYLEHSFGNLRQYAAVDMIAGSHFLTVLTRIATSCHSTNHLEALHRMGASLLDLSQRGLSGASLAAMGDRERELSEAVARSHPPAAGTA